MDDKRKKEVVAKSAGTYMGFTLFQTKFGFVALIGMLIVAANTEIELKKEIDRYLSARLN